MDKDELEQITERIKSGEDYLRGSVPILVRHLDFMKAKQIKKSYRNTKQTDPKKTSDSFLYLLFGHPFSTD